MIDGPASTVLINTRGRALFLIPRPLSWRRVSEVTAAMKKNVCVGGKRKKKNQFNINKKSHVRLLYIIEHTHVLCDRTRPPPTDAASTHKHVISTQLQTAVVIYEAGAGRSSAG